MATEAFRQISCCLLRRYSVAPLASFCATRAKKNPPRNEAGVEGGAVMDGQRIFLSAFALGFGVVNAIYCLFRVIDDKQRERNRADFYKRLDEDIFEKRKNRDGDSDKS